MTSRVPSIPAGTQAPAFEKSHAQVTATSPALLQATSSLHHSAKEPDSTANSKELYYGQLVMHIQKYSKRRAELEIRVETERRELLGVPTLVDEAERLSKIARDLVTKAEQACGESDAAQERLRVLEHRQLDFARRERYLQRLTDKLQRAKKRLRVD